MLETILEDAVDRNFDKFEIYVFRNLLAVPRDLLSEGWIRLKHHRGIDFTKHDKEEQPLDEQIAQLEELLLVETQANAHYKSRLQRIDQYLESIEQYKSQVKFLLPESNESLRSLEGGLGDIVAPLVGQTSELVQQVEALQDELAEDPVQMPVALRTRDGYLDAAARAILRQAGLDLYRDSITEEEAGYAVATAGRLLQ
jgi:kinetochore protein Mis12/MTW1